MTTTRRPAIARLLLAACSALSLPALAAADEGMWLLTKPPAEQLKKNYGFTPTPEWLERMQKAAVRVGASGSVVSKDGLVMTNHHVARGWIADLSSPQNNYSRDGYYAPTRDKELKIPGAEASILWSIEDVTAKVNAATANLPPAEANTARQKFIAELEQSEQKSTNLQCRVVTLYGGGQYHLYRAKRFTDLRLVFAPDADIAHFGGDTDNFEYPRFCLDATFVRLYENDQPAQTPIFVPWSANGAAENELTFVFGHPGRTERQLTVDHLRFLRDVSQPFGLGALWRNEIRLTTFANRSAEHQRVADQDLLNVANSRKARVGQLAGLQDPGFIAKKQADEETLRSAIAKDPKLAQQVGDAFEKWAKALEDYRTWHDRYTLLQRGLGGTLGGRALTILRLSEELPKPSGERLREFRDSALPSLYTRLYSTEPTYAFFEAFQLAGSLSLLAEHLGGDDPVVKAVLAGQSPIDRARTAIAGTKLADAAFRKQLVDGGKAAVDAAKDPLIELARAMDPEARALRKKYEDQIEGLERQVYAKIAAARFAIEGDSTYPDATGTLRLSYGPVKGYSEDGQTVAPFTTFGGLFERFDARKGQPEFALPERWIAARSKINPNVPFNFVNTADIIGGNSGSPVVNAKGEVVGLIFDGNIQSLPGAYGYDGTQNRAVAVDSRGIIEALRVVYGADALVRELTGK